jgi:hypothetical protein
MAKVALFILAQFAQQLAQLGGSVVAQLGFLRGKLRGLAVGKRIGGSEDAVEEREGGFNLEVMGGAAAAGRLLIELPYPFGGQGFQGEAFGRRPGEYSEPGAPVGQERIVGELTFFGGGGDPLKKRILPHRHRAPLPFLFPTASAPIIRVLTLQKEPATGINVAFLRIGGVLYQSRARSAIIGLIVRAVRLCRENGDIIVSSDFSSGVRSRRLRCGH